MHASFHSPVIRMLGCAAALWAVSGVASAGDRVYPNAEAAQPLAPGSSVPSVRVSTVDGTMVDLRETVRDHGALLVFYRGGW